MSSAIRVGVLGASKIAARSTVPALVAVDGVEVTTIAARDHERAEAFADSHGLKVATDYQAVIDDPEIDAVYVPLPNGLHYVWVLKARQAGKHVLCEKSLTGSYAQSQELIGLAERSGLVLVENFMCETHPQHEITRALVSEGNLGELRHIDLGFGFPPFPRDDQRNSADLQGGALNDAGAYCAFMARHYAGRAPISVSCVQSNGDYDVEVSGAALLDFGDGLTASLVFGFQHDYRNELRLWGSGGQILINRAFSIPAHRSPEITRVANTAISVIEAPAADQFLTQIQRFRDLITGEGDRSAEYGKLSQHAATMGALRESATQSGARVTLEDVTAGTHVA